MFEKLEALEKQYLEFENNWQNRIFLKIRKSTAKSPKPMRIWMISSIFSENTKRRNNNMKTIRNSCTTATRK